MSQVRLATLTVDNRAAVDAFAAASAAATRAGAEVEGMTKRLKTLSSGWQQIERTIPGSIGALERFSAMLRQAKLSADAGRISTADLAAATERFAQKYIGSAAGIEAAAMLEARGFAAAGQAVMAMALQHETAMRRVGDAEAVAAKISNDNAAARTAALSKQIAAARQAQRDLSLAHLYTGTAAAARDSMLTGGGSGGSAQESAAVFAKAMAVEKVAADNAKNSLAALTRQRKEAMQSARDLNLAYLGGGSGVSKSAGESAGVFAASFRQEKEQAEAATKAIIAKQREEQKNQDMAARWVDMLAQEEQAQRDAAAAVELRQKQAKTLLGTYAPLVSANENYAQHERDLHALFHTGALTADQYQATLSGLRQRQAENTHELDRMAKGARLSANQMQNLGYQVNDVVTQLASGTPVFQVVAQQGGQVAQAVGGIDKVMSYVFSPTGAAVAGLAALAAGMAAVVIRAVSLQGELRALQAQAVAYNNATLSGQQAQAAAHQMADTSPWFSRSDADAAIKELTKFRTLSADVLGGIRGVAADFAHVTGRDLADGAKGLADSFAKGYQGIKALDEEYGFLDANQLKTIRSLYEQQRGAEAAAIAMDALSAQMHRSADISKGDLTDGFTAMAAAWNKAIDSMVKNENVQGLMRFMARFGDLVSDAFSNDNAAPPPAADPTLPQIDGQPVNAALDGLISAAQSGRSAEIKDRKNADELAASYARQTGAIVAATQARRDYLEIQAEADQRFSAENQGLEKAAYINGELAKRAAARQVNLANILRETDLSRQQAAVWGESADSGLRLTAVLTAQEQARRGEISATEVQSVALATLTKAVNDNALAWARGAASRLADVDAAAAMAAAAAQGVEAEGKVADAIKARQERSADLAAAQAALAQATQSGNAATIQGAQESVDALDREIEARKTQLGQLRSLNALEEANRQIRSGQTDITLSERELTLMAGGIPADDRASLLDFEREKKRIQDSVYDDASKNRLLEQAERKKALADQRATYAKVEDFAKSTASDISGYFSDALEEGGVSGGQKMLAAIEKTLKHALISIPVNAVLTPYLTSAMTQMGIGMAGGQMAGNAGILGTIAAAGGSLVGFGGGAINAATGGNSSIGTLMGLGSLGLAGYQYWQGGAGMVGASTNLLGAQYLGTALSSQNAAALAASGQGTIVVDGAGTAFQAADGATIPISDGGIGLSGILGGATAALNNWQAWTSGSTLSKITTTGGTIAGGVIGNLIAPGLGGILAGAGLGSTIGNLVGGIFGGKKKQAIPYAYMGLGANASGLGLWSGMEGDGGSLASLRDTSEVTIRTLQNVFNSLGVISTSDATATIGYGEGGALAPDQMMTALLKKAAKSGRMEAGLYGQLGSRTWLKNGVAGGYGSEVVGTPSYSPGMDSWVQAAMAKSTATKMEDLSSEIDAAAKLRESVKALIPFRDALVVVDEQTKKTTKSMLDEWRGLITQASQLGGGDEATAAVKSRLEAMAKGQDLTDETASDMEKAVQQITSKYAVLKDGLLEYGMSVDLVTQGITADLQKLTDAKNKSTETALANYTGDASMGWTALLDSQKDSLKDAILVGADLTKLQALNYYQQREFLLKLSATQRDQLGLGNSVLTESVGIISDVQSQISQWGKWQSDLATQASTLAKTFADLVDTLASTRADLRQGDLSTLTPVQRLDEARAAFDTTAAQAAAGDSTAMAALSKQAQAFLTASQAYNASNSAYQADFQQVMDVLAAVGDVADTQASQQEALAAKLTTMTALLSSISDNLGATGAQAVTLTQLVDAYSVGNTLASSTNFAASLTAELQSRGISISDDIKQLIEGGAAAAPTVDAIWAANDTLISSIRDLPTDIVSEMQANPIIDLSPLIAMVEAEKSSRQAAALAAEVSTYNQNHADSNLAAEYQNLNYGRSLLTGGSTAVTGEVQKRLTDLNGQLNKGQISKSDWYDLVERAYQFAADNATSAGQWYQNSTAKLGYDRTEALAAAAAQRQDSLAAAQSWRKDQLAAGSDAAWVAGEYNGWVGQTNSTYSDSVKSIGDWYAEQVAGIQSRYKELIAAQAQEVAAIDKRLKEVSAEAKMIGLSLTYNSADKFDDVLSKNDAGSVVKTLISLSTDLFDFTSGMGNRLANYGVNMDIGNYWGDSVPQFADGGLHSGGWAVVGERGPELAYFGGPASIYTAEQSRPLLSSVNDNRVEAEIRALRQENRELRGAIDRLTAVVAEGARTTISTISDGNESLADVRSMLQRRGA